MKQIIKTIYGLIIIAIFGALVFYGLKQLNPKNPLDEIEVKIKEVETQEKILTESEKELVKEATEKEWQEVDKQTDK